MGKNWGKTSRHMPWKDWQIDALIVDAYGVLGDMYQVASLAIVGGSFNRYGGHNILEPLAFGLPVIVGKAMHHFEPEVRLAGKWLTMVDNNDLKNKVKAMLEKIEEKKKGEEIRFAGFDTFDGEDEKGVLTESKGNDRKLKRRQPLKKTGNEKHQKSSHQGYGQPTSSQSGLEIDTFRKDTERAIMDRLQKISGASRRAAKEMIEDLY